jgi:anti-sigma regulatory factor (Ser/Thr protein kinase)
MDRSAGVLVLPPIPRAPALARDHARRLGSTWSTELLELVLLVVSEAVTNAVRYGHGHVELSIRVRRDRIRIEVSDGNPNPPVRGGSPDGLGDGGRGLYLLDALTDAWGTQPRSTAPGKTVWLELITAR